MVSKSEKRALIQQRLEEKNKVKKKNTTVKKDEPKKSKLTE